MMLPRNFESGKTAAKTATGPTNPAGKEAVSKNAIVHGLAGRKHAALPGEEPAYEEFRRAMVEALAPVGPIEAALAESIAGNHWRHQRALQIENALFLSAEGGILEAWCDPDNAIQRVALYANRIQRAIEKNTAELRGLQTARKTAHAQAREEAVLLTQLAEANGETYDPAPDFPARTGEYDDAGQFVYSAPEIARLISRAGRLEDAKILFAPSPAAPLADAPRKAASKAA
jgi:hypothetical protein